MAFDLNALVERLNNGETAKLPPVHLWHPEHEGEIDIVIDAQMRWFHEGGMFQRQSLVKLLSSILRYENGHYYLVSPVEKLRITVADVPFEVVGLLEHTPGTLVLVTNTEELITLDANTVWELRSYQGQQIPYVEVRNGLFARIGRHVFYELVERAEQQQGDNGTLNLVICSANRAFPVGTADG